MAHGIVARIGLAKNKADEYIRFQSSFIMQHAFACVVGCVVNAPDHLFGYACFIYTRPGDCRMLRTNSMLSTTGALSQEQTLGFTRVRRK